MRRSGGRCCGECVLLRTPASGAEQEAAAGARPQGGGVWALGTHGVTSGAKSKWVLLTFSGCDRLPLFLEFFPVVV